MTKNHVQIMLLFVYATTRKGTSIKHGFGLFLKQVKSSQCLFQLTQNNN